MNPLVFNSNAEPTLGIEVELALVDSQSMALANAIQDVLAQVPGHLKDSIKPELMQSYVEVNTEVCNTIAEADRDLTEKLLLVQNITEDLGLRLYWSGTHPFSLWRDQVVTENERYYRLIDLLQDMARQLVCFGLHVHVGVNSVIRLS